MTAAAWTDYLPGDHRVTCPSCGRGERDKSAGLTVNPDGTSVLHCFRCSMTEAHRPDRTTARRAATIRPPAPAQEKRTTLSDWGRAIYRSCTPLAGTVGEQYLKARHCVIPPVDGALRYHHELKHPSGYTGPALVALVTNVLTNEAMSLHRTWVTPTGKADLETPRLPLAGHSLKGGCIRLWADDAVTLGLGVGEGIETALSLAHAFTPVWALIDAGHLAQFPVLAGIESLLIAQDQDRAGIDAADECARRWAAAGKETRVTDQGQNDVNDEIVRST